MGKLWLIISMLFLCGCAGFPCKECPIVAEVDSAEELHGCSLLKTFSYPGGDFIFGTPYMGDFKNEAIFDEVIAKSPEGPPPIEVYKIGEIYFVKDGNHRVSVARQLGVRYVDREILQEAAKILGVSRGTLIKRIADFGLPRPRKRS